MRTSHNVFQYRASNAVAFAVLASVVQFGPTAWAGAGASVPRSDGRTLHVDFENYVDGVVQALNAGVRWLGDPFSGRPEGTVAITRDFAFSGSRCAHVRSESVDRISRVRLQRRFDAPLLGDSDDGVIEFVFRPARSAAVDLRDLTIWEAKSSDGKAVGLVLRINGNATDGLYRIDVLHGPAAELTGSTDRSRTDDAVGRLRQNEWIRVIQHRRRGDGVVDLWIGPPGDETRTGTFADLSPGRDLFSVELGDTSTALYSGEGHWDDVRIGGLIGAARTLAPPEPPLCDVSRQLLVLETPITVDTTRQLFADDAIIESAVGLTRSLHPVTKHDANPLIVPEHPWEGKSVLLYGGVIRDLDSGGFRMWYLAWGKQLKQPSFICYAESDDGLRWHKPELGLMPYGGSKKNNIVLPGWSQTSVLHDPDDPDPSRRFKALLRLNGTRAFFSADGLRWRDMGVVIEQAYDGTTAHRDPVRNKWVAMVKIFRDGKRARGYAQSDDFLNWSDTCFLATVDSRDHPGDQMYALYMFHYESMYFGQLRMYSTDSDTIDIQLATSRNAKRWEREIRSPFIPTSPENGAWDFANNSVPSTPPIRVGNELWFYYSGRSTLHDVVPNDGAIGLATLRVDGFLSMDAGTAGGVLTTRPLRLRGTTLCLNASAADGEIRVEILEEDSRSIPAFTAANCDAITTDSIRQPVHWRDAESPTILDDRPIRLRFRMRNAALYAFWME